MRASKETLRKIREGVKTDTAGKVYTKLKADKVAVRNKKQVQNFRELETKRRTSLRNHADEVQYLQNLLHSNKEDNIVQEMFAPQNKQPSVVLYNDDAIDHLKYFCTSRRRTPSVLGIDR